LDVRGWTWILGDSPWSLHPGVIKYHHEEVEDLPKALEDNPGVDEGHSGVVEDHPGVAEDHPRAMKSVSGAIETGGL
jgi:hypothetical protein